MRQAHQQRNIVWRSTDDYAKRLKQVRDEIDGVLGDYSQDVAFTSVTARQGESAGNNTRASP